MERLHFSKFATPVNDQFLKIAKDMTLVKVSLTGDQLYEAYLSFYPEEVNGIFRERQHYDGAYDKNYIRRLGGVVGLDGQGKIHTIWDVKVPGYFQQVADKMASLVRNSKISAHFISKEPSAGSKSNTDDKVEGLTWTHFYTLVPSQHVDTSVSYLAKLGDLKTNREMYVRAMEELSLDSAETVLELINSNSLYRGSEFVNSVRHFISLKQKYHTLKTEHDKHVYSFIAAKVHGDSVRFRNSAIGTLVVDLSEGVELNKAVASFESKVAPTNYKRTTALVTPRMIEEAKKTLAQEGLLDSLDRCFATESHIDLENIIFKYTPKKAQDVFDDLIQNTKVTVDPKSFNKVETMSIEDFIKNVVPTATSVEAYVENSHKKNFVTLLTSTTPNTKPLFKWDNNFSWAYTGDVTDSIKETVKKFGGAVEGDLRISLSWYNSDDLDLHLGEPGSYRISYNNRGKLSPCHGTLDLDMNGLDKHSDTEPVENIIYTSKSKMKQGVYTVIVNNYSKRSNENVGFTLQVEFDGRIHNFKHIGAYNSRQTMFEIVLKGSEFTIQNVNKNLESGISNLEMWNVTTNTFVPVTLLTNSPNYWGDNKTGNKHFFFILDQCKTPESTRTFYNEFLNDEVTKHRKVLEVLGSKTKIEPAEEQLSGLGISTTSKETLTVRVKGKTQRILNITF